MSIKSELQSIEPELRKCVVDYLREYIARHGEKKDIPEEERPAPDVYYFWKVNLAEYQIEDIADDIIVKMKKTLGKYIYTSLFGEEEE